MSRGSGNAVHAYGGSRGRAARDPILAWWFPLFLRGAATAPGRDPCTAPADVIVTMSSATRGGAAGGGKEESEWGGDGREKASCDGFGGSLYRR